MPIIAINEVGSVGVVKDQSTDEMPPNVWSDALNVRFYNSYVEKIKGDSTYGSAGLTPIFVAQAENTSTGALAWMYASATAVRAYNVTADADISRASGGAYTGASSGQPWTFCELGGLPILNNGADTPQVWSPVSTAQKLVPVPSWPAGYTCKALRAYKQMLVMLDVTNGATRYPQRIKWSDAADPGSTPASWDITDPALLAGENDLMDNGEAVVDLHPLGDIAVVYKEGSCHSMQFVEGDQLVFRFQGMFRTLGVVSRNCVAMFDKTHHLVFTGYDIVMHDGYSADSILTQKLRKWLQANISSTNYANSFVVVDRVYNEVWTCFPSTNATWCDTAIVWNYVHGTLSVQSLTTAAHAAEGFKVLSSTTFDKRIRNIVLANGASAAMYLANDTEQTHGGNITAYVERQGLGIPVAQGQPPDQTQWKMIRAIWPRLEGTVGGVVTVSLAGMASHDATPSYTTFNYTIGTNTKIDTFVSGRVFAIKFSSNTNISWKLHGYELDYQPGGRF